MTTPTDPKREALQKDGALNSHPEKVSDELFLEREFFDARDLVQVKYEMLRRVQAEGKTVSETARDFGFSRPSFYQARDAFRKAGLSGLIPKKRGPRGGHKLTEEVMTYPLGVLEREGSVETRTLVERIRERFGFTVHPRTIERALARKKNRIEESTVVKACRSAGTEEVMTYEQIRQVALDRTGRKNGDYGCAVLVNRGMAAWLRALGEYTPARTARPRRAEPARGEDFPELREEIVGVLIRMAFTVAR